MIVAEKITDISLARRAIERTSRYVQTSKANLHQIYQWEHSPIRTQLFYIEMTDIPTYVSVHFVRHSIGVTHYVLSNRADRGGSGSEDRMTPVNHSMLINAQAIINMERLRLCYQADEVTREVALEIKEAIRLVDQDLAHFLVPDCVYRGGVCVQPKPCGNYRVRRYFGEDTEKVMRITA